MCVKQLHEQLEKVDQPLAVSSAYIAAKMLDYGFDAETDQGRDLVKMLAFADAPQTQQIVSGLLHTIINEHHRANVGELPEDRRVFYGGELLGYINQRSRPAAKPDVPTAELRRRIGLSPA